MYLGHSFLAFAVVAAAGRFLDVDSRQVLVLATLAAGYGLLPDVDVWRTVYVFLREGPEGVFPTEQHVWQHSWVVHRALTHSVVTGGAAALASGLAVRATDPDVSPARLVAAGGLAAVTGGLLWVAHASAGRPGVVTMALFLGGALALALVGHGQGVSAAEVGAVAAVGLLTHPFGDLWMGQPPALLAPLVSDPPLAEMTLSRDPVLHFLAAVGIEVALLGACIHLICALTGHSTTDYLSPLALLGVGYAAVLGRVPAPTFAEAYQFCTGLFVLSLLVTLLSSVVDHRGASQRPVRARAFVTGVVAFGLGLAAYAVVYALG